MMIYPLTKIDGKTRTRHRVAMEKHLGRQLDRNEFVHHRDGNKRNYDLANLEILTPKEHNDLHLRKKPIVYTCLVCGTVFEPSARHRGRKTCGRECRRKLMREVAKARPKPTHCWRGHELTNSYVTKTGKRNCRICGMLNARRYRRQL